MSRLKNVGGTILVGLIGLGIIYFGLILLAILANPSPDSKPIKYWEITYYEYINNKPPAKFDTLILRSHKRPSIRQMNTTPHKHTQVWDGGRLILDINKRLIITTVDPIDLDTSL